MLKFIYIFFLFSFFSLSFATKEQPLFIPNLELIIEQFSYQQKADILNYQAKQLLKKGTLTQNLLTLKNTLLEELKKFPVNTSKLNKLYSKLNQAERNLEYLKFQQFSFILSLLNEEQFNILKQSNKNTQQHFQN